MRSSKARYFSNFYPRPPRGGRHLRLFFNGMSVTYFYPRPPRGGRHGRLKNGMKPANFYPRPPRGGRQRLRPRAAFAQKFLSTPSARRATAGPGVATAQQRISIHALREEGDEIDIHLLGCTDVFLSTPSARRATLSVFQPVAGIEKISIHALREEGDDEKTGLFENEKEFLSTPSARRATGILDRPRPSTRISIHALREEGDRGRNDRHGRLW